MAYDGGDATEVLRWESDAASANFHDAAPNEHVTLNLDNPSGAGEMVLTFGLTDAGNDWWWAVDNVSVSAVPEPSSALLAALSGLMLLARRRRRA